MSQKINKKQKPKTTPQFKSSFLAVFLVFFGKGPRGHHFIQSGPHRPSRPTIPRSHSILKNWTWTWSTLLFSLTWMGGPGPFHILCLDFVLVSVLPKGSWIQWKSWKLDHCLISFLSGQKPQLKLSDPKDDWRACADSKTHLQQPRENRHVKPARLLSPGTVTTGRYDAFSQSLSPSPASFLEFSGTIEMTHATSLSRKKIFALSLW